MSTTIIERTSYNLVRDRTLVLRVLVPGLHTRLSDKINSTQNGEGSKPPSSTVSNAASGGKPADQLLLNLDGVTCSSSGAMVPLIPHGSPVEVHKTHDHATYHKSADIGQMLIVYEDEYAMEEAENEKGYRIEGFPSYFHSGLTPPMKRVVRRRFLSRFEERDVKPIPPRKSEVAEVENEVKTLIEKLSGDKSKTKGKKGSSSSTTTTKDRIIEEIEEEVVDYEPWMGEGGTFTLEDAKSHPEWWLSKAEIKEIYDAKQEELRKEREAIEAQRAEMEAQTAAAAEKKAKKKKKREEKKKKQQEEEELLAATIDAPERSKNGIPAMNLMEDEPIDEVTQAAMTISQGIDNEELLLDDDMFDFENEDITDLF